MTTRTKLLLCAAILVLLSIPYWDFLRTCFYLWW
jgi:hypothetical protein